MMARRSFIKRTAGIIPAASALAFDQAPMPAAVKTGYAPVNGLRMYYETHGNPRRDRVPLILLHGGGDTIETSFGKILPVLARTRLVIAFEQQGYGHTADVDRPFSFEQSAKDTTGLMRYLKISKADIFGFSNGGHIALELGISHKESVRKLVVESAMFNREGADPAFWESFKHVKLADMPAELRQAYLKVAPHPEDLHRMFEKAVQRMLQFKGWRPEEIRSIQSPTLVMVGDHDIVRPEHAVEMFRLLPHAQLAILPDTNHMTIPNRSDWVPTMVDAFLDSPMPGPQAS
jgi:pimeloyl-ACP methyl ester carboxylesterase